MQPHSSEVDTFGAIDGLHKIQFSDLVRFIPAWVWLAALLLFSTCKLFSTPASDYIVKTWGVDDGLPESGISGVVQTADGYIWVSTLYSGVARFDGVRFVTFDAPFGANIKSQAVHLLYVDSSGVLWLFGYGKYLASLRQGEFHAEYSWPNDLQRPPAIISLIYSVSNRVVFATDQASLMEQVTDAGTNSYWRTIAAPGAKPYAHYFADVQGNFWYARTDGRVARIVNGKAELMSLASGSEQFSAFAGDKAGRIAVANTEGLFIWENGAFHEQMPEQEAGSFNPRGMISDGQGGWWLEVNGHLRRYRDRKWIAESSVWREQGRSWSQILTAQPDGAGGLWLAYIDGGIIHIGANGEFTALTSQDGLPSNRVRTMVQDREGNLWASFERGGLARIRPRLFQSVGNREGLAESATTSVCEDAQGAIWIGTANGMVSRWRDNVCTNFILPLSQPYAEMSAVCPDPAGRVWIGIYGNGLWVWETNQFRSVLPASQVGGTIRGVFVSRDGRVWIASQSGLFCLAGGKVRQMQTPKAEVDYPMALAEETDGTIWVAMHTGELLKLAAGGIEKIKPPAALRCPFTTVLVDREGTVWIGTQGAGLLRFRGGQFSAINAHDGLPNDHISQVMEDGCGNLWLGSPTGIFLVPKASLASHATNITFRAFNRDDGLLTMGCAIGSQPTVWHARDGRIWFAMSKGVTSVNPQAPGTKQLAPLVVIEEMLVDGEPKLAGDKRAHFTTNAPLELEPGRHHLDFQFSALNFAAPERLRFNYRLEGWVEAWQENRAERTASYNGLLPGKYIFRVRARNGDGVWSGSEMAVPFVVPPHVWETWWFHAALLAAVLFLVTGSVWWFSHVRHLQRVRLLEQRQALEHERTRIAQDIHDDLGASLTRIGMLSQSALDKTQAEQTPAAEVNRIYATACAMTSTMDEIVWAINPHHDSLDSVAEYFAEFVEEYLSTSGLKFRLDIPLNLPPQVITSELRHNLFLAFKEALNNTVKHARAGEVVVTLCFQGKVLLLSVEDNGCGFEMPTAAGNHPDKRRGAGGNGLQNMRQRLEALGGRCHIESVPGRGTRVSFEVNLPA